MKTQSYNIFWQQIHRLAKKKGFPLRVMFELTYRCNFYCKHCYVPFKYRKYKELKTKEVFSILDQLADLGCFYLGFTGGEPFMRKDILDILCYAKKKGFAVIVYSNGSLINEARAKELVNLRPNKVDITIPGMSKTTFEHISGVAGSYDKVFRAIDFLSKSGVNLGFKTCLLKENEKEIEEIQKFATSLEALYRLDDTLSARLDGSREPFKYRGILKDTSGAIRSTPLAQDDISKVSLEQEIAECSQDARQIDNLFKCGVGVSQAAITPAGELKMCLMIDYPKYRILNREDKRQKTDSGKQRVSLKDAWEKLKNLLSEIKPNLNYPCAKCELQPYCKWCPATSWLYQRNFISCEPETYRKAELVRELQLKNKR